MTIFDKEKAFQAECAEHLDRLRKHCIHIGVPFFFTACVRNDEQTGSKYISDGIITGSDGIELADDQIKRHLLVNIGFDVIPSKDDLEIQMDDPDQ